MLMLRWALIAAAAVIGSWVVLSVLARRLPPGLLKDLAGLIPACVTTCRRLRKDERVPRSAKLAVIAAMLWVASPVDLIPEFVPVVGPLDDVVVVALLLRFAARRVPRTVLREAWAGEPHVLERLLMPRRTRRAGADGGG